LVYTKIIIEYYRSFDILLFLSTVKISLPLDERQNLTNKVEQAELARHVIRRKITGESLDKFFEKTKCHVLPVSYLLKKNKRSTHLKSSV